jgi:hypothetical protein
MPIRNIVRHLTDIVEEDTPISWQRDRPVLLTAIIIILISGPCLILALWVRRRNVRIPWDAKDNWRGTRQFAITLAIVDVLLVVMIGITHILAVPNGWWWIFTRLIMLWIWWMLLSPALALLLERIDPRTPTIYRILYGLGTS